MPDKSTSARPATDVEPGRPAATAAPTTAALVEAAKQGDPEPMMALQSTLGNAGVIELLSERREGGTLMPPPPPLLALLASCMEQSASSGSSAPTSTPGASGSAVTTHEANNRIAETISNAPAPYKAWNGTYSWDSKFALAIDTTAKTVTVVTRLYAPTATPQAQADWAKACESKWSGKRSLLVQRAGEPKPTPFAIAIDVQWVTDPKNAHYTIKMNKPGASSGGRAGHGGTTSMVEWGEKDTVDVTHEFGHMLGNPEDYFTTNGVDHTHGGKRMGFRDKGGGILNNPSEDPLAKHYETIRSEAAKALALPSSSVRIK